jgi:hypothetical protein
MKTSKLELENLIQGFTLAYQTETNRRVEDHKYIKESWLQAP